MRPYHIFLGVLAAIFGGLLFLDVLMTTAILNLGGTELNPVMRFVVNNPYLHMIVKFIFAGFVIWVVSRAEQMKEYSGALFLIAVCSLFMIVFIHNIHVFMRGVFT